MDFLNAAAASLASLSAFFLASFSAFSASLYCLLVNFVYLLVSLLISNFSLICLLSASSLAN